MKSSRARFSKKKSWIFQKENVLNDPKKIKEIFSDSESFNSCKKHVSTIFDFFS